ncbi:unnamed protein product [Didymodactylos carnosus]|uniref:Uncharacterized protein n=1 Tax=Didymodactylos carnosus TaxID=1234261 RepID=A0A814UV02_9BILA|nr:unnamed protein product [Didymodactylos carnosus]CAF3943751.1 unnamed protein product [Didymodactylos carnosus]
MQTENSGRKVTYVELSKDTSFNKKTCKLWWDRKDLLLKTGTLCDRKKGKSGRPIHQSFSNKQEIDHAITVCENLQIIANQYGYDVYLHGQTQLRPRKQVETWVDEQVNEQTYLRGLKSCVVPFVKATNSKILMSDCVNLNHTLQIQQFLSKNGIELYGSAGYHQQVEGAYSPYSHDCSILDSSMFGTFQSQIANEIASNTHLVDSDDILNHMSKIIPQIWKSDKYKIIAKNHIAGYAKRLQTIIDNDGGFIAKYK